MHFENDSDVFSGHQSNGVSNGTNGNGESGIAKIDPWQPFVEEAVDSLNSVMGSSEYSFSRPSGDSDILTLPVGACVLLFHVITAQGEYRTN